MDGQLGREKSEVMTGEKERGMEMVRLGGNWLQGKGRNGTIWRNLVTSEEC